MKNGVLTGRAANAVDQTDQGQGQYMCATIDSFRSHPDKVKGDGLSAQHSGSYN